MNFKLSLLFFFAIGTSFLLKEKGNQATYFVITKTIPYCGGASPSEEMVKESQRKRIPVGETFYIIRGEENTTNRKIIDSIIFGKQSMECAKLSPGKYSLINKNGYKPFIAKGKEYDNDCLKKIWATPLISFTVVKNKCDTVVFNIAENCPYNNPCKKEGEPLPSVPM